MTVCALRGYSRQLLFSTALAKHANGLAQGLANWFASQIWPTTAVFVNKILLEHSNAHLFMYSLWLLFHYSGTMEQLPQRPYGPQSLKYLLCCFTESLPTPCLEEAICWHSYAVYPRLWFANRAYPTNLDWTHPVRGKLCKRLGPVNEITCAVNLHQLKLYQSG